jgi:hypothetical protein
LDKSKFDKLKIYIWKKMENNNNHGMDFVMACHEKIQSMTP